MFGKLALAIWSEMVLVHGAVSGELTLEILRVDWYKMDIIKLKTWII